MNQVVDSQILGLLKTFNPIRDLSHAALLELAHNTRLVTFPIGRVLFTINQTDKATVYLIKGSVQLTDIDGGEQIVRGGTLGAQDPLANHQPRLKTATALSNIVFIRINTNLLEILSAKENESSIQVVEIQEHDTQVENRLLFQLYTDYMTGRLELPSLPELAVRVRRAVRVPDTTAYDIAKIVQADPAIAMRLIQVANSPLYRGDQAVTNCQSAILRLGMDNTRDLVTGFTLRKLFSSKSRLVAQRMNELWQHSTHVAVISAVVAKMVISLNADRALLAGLIHDIGVLVILAYADRFPELIDSSLHLTEAIQKNRAQIGAMVLRKWGFAGDLVAVALHADDWQWNSENGPDYCDIIIVAQLHSYLGTPKAALFPSILKVPAFYKLPFSKQGPKKSLQVLSQANNDIKEMKRLLSP